MGHRGASFGIAAAIALVLGFATPADGAAPGGSVVLFSERGDFVGAGTHRLYNRGNAQITVGWRGKGYVTVSASGGSRGDGSSLDFAAPPGRELRRGVYDSAERAPFREPGRAGIDIGVDHRGCNVTTGRFQVKQLALTPTGQIKRLWIVFEQHCEGAMPGLYGEVRLGIPAGRPGWYTTPRILRWPEGDRGRPTATSPITVVATAARRMAAVTVVGKNAGDFPIRTDRCSGRSLAKGVRCAIRVQFVPHATGTRRAALQIIDGGGHRRKVLLQGFSHSGTTKLVMHSDRGDYMGQGMDWSYTPANAVFAPYGGRQWVTLRLWQPEGAYWADDRYWGLGFFPATGGAIRRGRYAGATKGPDAGTVPGLSVTTGYRSCNTVKGEFNVTEARFDKAGVLKTLGLSFVQHCDGAAPALRGTLEIRKGDRTRPAPWMPGG